MLTEGEKPSYGTALASSQPAPALLDDPAPKKCSRLTALRAVGGVLALALLAFLAVKAWSHGVAAKDKASASPHMSCDAPLDNEEAEALLCYRFGALDLSDGVIGSVPVSEGGMMLSMTLTIHSFGTGWTNILHVGTESKVRQPLVGTNEDGLRVAFSGSVAAYDLREAYSYPDAPIEQEFQLRIVRQGSEARVYIDGALHDSFQLDDHDVEESCAEDVWAGRGTSADVTVSNLVICPFYDDWFEPKVPLVVNDGCSTDPEPWVQCQRYKDQEFENGQEVAQMPLVSEGSAVFIKLTVNEQPSSFKAILHVGNTDQRRQPMIGIEDGDVKVQIGQQTESFHLPKPTGVKFWLKIFREGLDVTVSVDSMRLGSFTVQESDLLASCAEAVMVGDADVEIHQIALCPYFDKALMNPLEEHNPLYMSAHVDEEPFEP